MFDLFRLGLVVSFQRGIYRNTYSSSGRTRRQPATGPSRPSAENVDAVLNRIVVPPPEHAHEGGSELRRSSRVRTVLWYDKGLNVMSYICWMYNSFSFGCSFFVT